MMYIVFALLLAGDLMVKHDGRNPWVLLCFIMPRELLRSYYSDFLQLRVGRDALWNALGSQSELSLKKKCHL